MVTIALYNTEGIIIRVRDFDDADKIAVLLTRDHGKVQMVAKGARRPRNRYTAATQLFTHVTASLFHGRNMDTLSQIDIAESFRNLREDLVRMAYGAYVCELMDEFVKEKLKFDTTFLLLLTTLHLLNTPDVEPEPVLRAYELKLLSILGLRPSLESCVGCGGDIGGEGPVRFAPSLGGVLCATCTSEGEPVLRLSRGALSILKHLLEGDIGRAHLLRIGREMSGEIDKALSAYVGYHTERPLKSKEFLDTVRG